MLTICDVPMTRSVRVVWLCRELQLPHEATTISFAPVYRNSPEWRQRNPVGKVPAMTDGFSAADIMMGYSVMLAQRYVPIEGYANVARYWQSLSARSALQEALAIVRALTAEGRAQTPVRRSGADRCGLHPEPDMRI